MKFFRKLKNKFFKNQKRLRIIILSLAFIKQRLAKALNLVLTPSRILFILSAQKMMQKLIAEKEQSQVIGGGKRLPKTKLFEEAKSGKDKEGKSKLDVNKLKEKSEEKSSKLSEKTQEKTQEKMLEKENSPQKSQFKDLYFIPEHHGFIPKAEAQKEQLESKSTIVSIQNDNSEEFGEALKMFAELLNNFPRLGVIEGVASNIIDATLKLYSEVNQGMSR